MARQLSWRALALALGACALLALVPVADAVAAEDRLFAEPAANGTAKSDSSDQKAKPDSQPAKPQQNPADAYKGNVKVSRILEASIVYADAFITKTFTTLGDAKVDGALTAATISCKTADVGKVRSNFLIPKAGKLQIDGDVLLLNSQLISEPSVGAVSFIAEDVVIGGVKQWKLVRHEDFEGADAAQGWSLAETSSCTGRDHFLGGHCKIADGELKKRFESLPPHKQVRLTARYHMIDNWQGETAFLKLDEHFAWADHSRPSKVQHGINMCGSAEFPERRMSIPIDVTLPHAASFLEVAFGSTSLAEHDDPCSRSFGVDDVMLYVR